MCKNGVIKIKVEDGIPEADIGKFTLKEAFAYSISAFHKTISQLALAKDPSSFIDEMLDLIGKIDKNAPAEVDK